MTISLGFDVNDDITDAVVTGDLAIQNRVVQQLRLFLGEWFLDNAAGVDHWSVLGEKNPNLQAYETELKSKIVSVQGVARILGFDLIYDQPNRALKIDTKIQLDNGEELEITEALI